MKYIKKFNEGNYEKSIEDWCKYFEIKDYTINDNNVVDVSSGVYIWSYNLEKIPIQFGICYGNFYCSSNLLTTLEGCAKEVGGDFYCQNNKLINLIGGPKEIGGDYFCNSNNLISLEGMPENFKGLLNCSDNPIEYIYHFFGTYKRYKDSLDYNYLRGTNIIKLRFKEAMEEIGREVPDSIPYYKYI